MPASCKGGLGLFLHYTRFTRVWETLVRIFDISKEFAEKRKKDYLFRTAKIASFPEPRKYFPHFIPLGFIKIQSIFLSVLSKKGEKTWKYHHIALSLPPES